MSRFHLYRHFDADGDLLYVGQSNNAFKRYTSHRSASHWAEMSVTMQVEHFDSFEEVLSAEREAIVRENPRFNIIRAPLVERPQRSVRFDPGLWERIDDWRREEADLPGRSEALRRLVEQALSFKGGKK